VTPVVLSEFCNVGLVQGTNKGRDKPTGDNLANLPFTMRVESVEFQVRGVVQLASSYTKELSSGFPKAIERVPIGHTVTRLHFLHGTVWPAKPRTPVARLTIRYADGEQTTIPVVYGVDVEELIYDPAASANGEAGKPAWTSDETGLVALTAGKSRQAVWKLGPRNDKDWELICYGSAENLPPLWRTMKEGPPSPRRWGTRLYKLTWLNPRPQVAVSSMDYVSAMSSSAPFLLAATVE
jgi:hypothetical protein